MQENLGDLKAANIQIVGISPDAVDKLKTFSDASSIKFPLLADADSKTIDAFGIHNERGLPHPGTIVIDSNGKIVAKIFREGFRERHPAGEIMDEVSALSK